MAEQKKYTYLKDDDKYQRPKQTYTDQLTSEQIAEKLSDYIQVDDMKFVKKGTHLRYRIPDKKNPGEMKFCVGGFLKFKHADYVILSQSPYNSKDAKSWSVQTKDAIFYRKLSPQEQTDNRIQQLEAEVVRLRAENAMLKAQNAHPIEHQVDQQVTNDEFAPITVGKKNKSKKRVKKVKNQSPE